MPLTHQFTSLLLLALLIACGSRTVTREEVLHEPREYCWERSQNCKPLPVRNFYLFTCEYCFSRYVTLFFLVLTRFTMLYNDGRG